MSTLNLKISDNPEHALWAVDTETLSVSIEGNELATLVGFSKDDETATVDLSSTSWVANPGSADGMHPVIRSSAGDGVLSVPVIATIREDQP